MHRPPTGPSRPDPAPKVVARRPVARWPSAVHRVLCTGAMAPPATAGAHGVEAEPWDTTAGVTPVAFDREGLLVAAGAREVTEALGGAEPMACGLLG